MSSGACDKAGCSTIASWNRSATLVANHIPERLCARHYQEFVKERPVLARHYEALGEEKKGDTSSV